MSDTLKDLSKAIRVAAAKIVESKYPISSSITELTERNALESTEIVRIICDLVNLTDTVRGGRVRIEPWEIDF